jgi:Terminase RNaseH-like domain
MSTTGTTLRVRLPALHPGQAIIRQQARRFNWLCAGRRFRKTTLAMSIVVEAALTGGEYMWCAPTYKQVRVGWDETHHACGGVVEFNESRMEARFPGGGIIHFVSLTEPDNARGKTADGIEIDEASECPSRSWTEILRPMLMDTGGWLWATFTPKGQNWVWQEHQKATIGDDPDSRAWQVPSVGCAIVDGTLVRRRHPLENPDIPFSELEDMFGRMPERVFRQEIMAEFLDDAGGVFRGVERCVGGALETAPPHRMQQYVIGIDLAKHQDYTVLCVGDLRERRVVAFDRFNKADWGLQKARIITTAKLWNDAVCWMDTTGIGDPIYDDLRRAGLRIHGYKFTSATKTALINNAVLMVEQQSVRYPAIAQLVNELKAYQYTTSATGHLQMAAPEGLFDDAVIGFALMCWPLGQVPAARIPPEALEQLRAPFSEIGGVRLLGKTF